MDIFLLWPAFNRIYGGPIARIRETVECGSSFTQFRLFLTLISPLLFFGALTLLFRVELFIFIGAGIQILLLPFLVAFQFASQGNTQNRNIETPKDISLRKYRSSGKKKRSNQKRSSVILNRK